MRKTPVSAARRRLKFGGISERKQTELIHHPVCLNLSGVCLPFGWREINRLALTSGNILPTGLCVCSFLLSDWFQLQIQSVQLRDGLVSSNHRAAFYLNCSQHCLWALGNKDREDSVNVASACLLVVLHCVNMLKMLMQRLTQQGETLPPLIDQRTRQTAISCLWL